MESILLKQLDQRMIELAHQKLIGGELTSRELWIVHLMFLGLTIKEIADKLSISEDTVNSHIKAIHHILKLHKNSEINKWYLTQLLTNHGTH